MSSKNTVVKVNVLTLYDGVEINPIQISTMRGQGIISECKDCFQGIGQECPKYFLVNNYVEESLWWPTQSSNKSSSIHI